MSKVKTSFWHKDEGGKIVCDICPRHCRLQNGQRGHCFVRECEDSEIWLNAYGLASTFCIDPIEKKPLNHFLPGTPVLSFGTIGCNLGCKFCQNWTISTSGEMGELSEKGTPEEIAAAAVKYGCRSVAFTYNEPVIFFEYARDVAKTCHQKRIKTVAVTAGYIEKGAREEFFSFIDAANVDLKSFSEDFYRKYCSASLAPVLETLKYIREKTKVWLEITCLLIPGLNDSPEEIEALTHWIATELGPQTPLHLSAFHPSHLMMDVLPTPPATLMAAREIALKNGLRYVYTGNIYDERGGSTWCSSCGKKLISRRGYIIHEWNLVKGRCRFCQTEPAGIFEEKPGTWGDRRLPIHV
jgi:pyruvate formate lyase activating enzyme